MTIGVYFITLPQLVEGQRETYRQLAGKLIRSIRRAMPTVEVVQLTDAVTPVFPGMDTCWRHPRNEPMMLHRLTRYAMCQGEWLFLDIDILVFKDVSPVFTQDFDIAIADRSGVIMESEVRRGWLPTMPHNAGVIFSRSPAFWHAAHQECQLLPVPQHEWMGDQVAINTVIQRGEFKVLVLPGTEYNYAPKSQFSDEDVIGRAIVHYKGGQRKCLMLATDI